MSINVIHGFWTPDHRSAFVQSGSFCIWVETDNAESCKSRSKSLHPFHYRGEKLLDFLHGKLSFLASVEEAADFDRIKCCPVYLPTQQERPLPSPELRHLVKSEVVESESKTSLGPWKINGFCLTNPINDIAQVFYSSIFEKEGVTLGQDFYFWYYFSQSLREIIVKDQYIPGLIQVIKGKSKQPQIYPKWQIVSASYEKVVINEQINQAVRQLPVSFCRKWGDSFLTAYTELSDLTTPPFIDRDVFARWHHWQQKIAHHGFRKSFDLGFQLVNATEENPERWRIDFVAISLQDPSYQVPLAAYWSLSESEKKQAYRMLGGDFEFQLIQQLGQAAQIYAPIWMGMESEAPRSVSIDRESAFRFLKRDAWILEEAGFKIIVPAWWTPQGRQRAKLRLRSGQRAGSAGTAPNSAGLSLAELVDYRYELAIGEHTVSPEEWQQLVNSKSSLVQFRGQWMELDQKQMAQMLSFWQQQESQSSPLALPEIMHKLATEDDSFEVAAEDDLGQMLAKLSNQAQFTPVENPEKLQGKLREYQKVGVAWLHYLDRIGLNGCLADDMGLGKTLQVICSILLDQQQTQSDRLQRPTLLVVPTSVMGNWQKEVARFAPHLSVSLHHGSVRQQDQTLFVREVLLQDLVITSYALIRRDSRLFASVDWHRIVLDEAQNIKNPKAEQTKAIHKLTAKHRLALTGTPIENRLMDLWSIFQFLNPGYLGTRARFRKQYELPIQRDKNPAQAKVLKQLLKPFILRRLKTDKTVIQDLPDKVENKLYCNLGKEQASLYQAVVEDVAEQLNESEGIARQGLMLATLMKLKQICNHPAQFLQDGSVFSASRSHKLQRLSEMLEEALSEGDSALVFTQFTEIGSQIQTFLREQQVPTHYLHGGVSPRRRQTMIDEFQNPESGPSVFILSIKAGGAGITLTKANHVFHFDRWWNPAVENQATDRAFRIGQKKNVFVHKFITLGTLEERIDDMIEEKKKVADLVGGSDESWIARLSNDQFKQLIALSQQTIME